MNFGTALSDVSLGVFGTSVFPHLAYPYLACFRPNKQFEKDYALRNSLHRIWDQKVILKVSEIQKEMTYLEYGERQDGINEEDIL